nr:Chain B, C-Jun-amino-terminal kinase-interacting protein 1 [Homo sapiens]
KPKRPTTLNLF